MKNLRDARLALLTTIVAVACSCSSGSQSSAITVRIRPEAVLMPPGQSVSFSATVSGGGLKPTTQRFDE
jgi:hypothetical protein